METPNQRDGQTRKQNMLEQRRNNDLVQGAYSEVPVDDPATIQQTADCSSIVEKHDMMYQVQDNPPWYVCIVLAFQQYLLTIVGIPFIFIVTERMCIGNDDVGRSEVIATALVIYGITTFLQATFGSRLPIVEGASLSYILPSLAILGLPEWKCPEQPVGLNNTELVDWTRGVWTTRMREIQGAITVAGVVQMVIGLSGVISLLLRFIGPICIAAFLTLLGLSPFLATAAFSAKQWGVAFMVIVLMTIFSQYLRKINVPFLGYKRGEGFVKLRFPIFRLIPIIGAVVITWLLCLILTAANVWPKEPGLGNGYDARTDIKLSVLQQAKWFRVPYPGQWGMPTVSVGAALGMVAGSMAGIIESIGDYHACALMSGAPVIPDHAVNRGIMIEGFGIMLSGLCGTGVGLTSYSHNIGAISIIKVASRRVVQWCGVIVIILGLLAKSGAVFVTIPEPILGGILLSTFGIITGVGVSTLRFVDMTSSRNLYIYGSSVFVGLTVSVWMAANPAAIKTGSIIVDQILTVILSIGMLIGGVCAFVLDNTVPGTKEERGLLKWRKEGVSDDAVSHDTRAVYGLPYVMTWIERWNWTRFIPVCPTFSGIKCCRRRRTSFDAARKK